MGIAPCTITTDAHRSISATFVLDTIAASSHTCALVPANGAVRCWGTNTSGQLGLGNTTNLGDVLPASAGQPAIASGAIQVVAGYSHSCALMNDGTVRCWGANDRGQLGYGNTENIGDNESVGVESVVIGRPAVQLAAGGEHTCALLDTGNVRCWGYGQLGQLGYGSASNLGDAPDTLPFANGDVPIGEVVVQISAGQQHTCALTAIGTAYCWGSGANGRLGYGDTANVGRSPSTTPELTGPLNVGEPVKQVIAGGTHTCVLLSAGRVKCWGQNLFGELGYGNTVTLGDEPGEVPVNFADVSVGGVVVRLVAGPAMTCALLQTQEARCWGWDNSGSDGLPGVWGPGASIVPSAVNPINLGGAVVELATAAYPCARMATGAVRCWGDGANGRLGHGNTDDIGDDEDPADAGDVPYLP